MQQGKDFGKVIHIYLTSLTCGLHRALRSIISLPQSQVLTFLCDRQGGLRFLLVC